MRGRPPVGEDELYEIAVYLSDPRMETEIHAELPNRHRVSFEEEYNRATNLKPPEASRKGPYYVWPEGTNKYGRELRIYFNRIPPEPPLIKNLIADHGKWYSRSEQYRINHSRLVMQLFECGYLLGDNSKMQQRIKDFMQKRFPVK